MWDRYEFKPGDRVARADGAWAEVLSAVGDGALLRVRYIGERGEPSEAGTEETLAVNEVASVSPAPTRASWGRRVTLMVHRVPETDETEGGFEAVTMIGVPLGVSVAVFDDNAQEALDRLLQALAAFGYSGSAAVEDATGLGRPERYEVQVSGEHDAFNGV